MNGDYGTIVIGAPLLRGKALGVRLFSMISPEQKKKVRENEDRQFPPSISLETRHPAQNTLPDHRASENL
jgi:hypothetical protein